MSRRRPTVACLSFTFQYKPFLWCRADVRLWHAVIYFPYKPFMWCRSDARLWHVLYFYPFEASLQTPDWFIIFYSLIAYFCLIWMTCLHASWILFRDWLSDHELFQCMIIICYIIPVFMMFASTFKVLTGLSLAIVLARFLAWRGAKWRQPRNLGTDDISRAKIGVIQVSCSCGKWSPIDADDPEPLPPSTTSKPFVVLIDHNGLVLHILYLAWNFCIKIVPHQLTVILGLVSTRTIY
jgi:hypothetical protein